VVVSYNHERFIETALRSAFQQTHPEVKVIVADDASTDASQEEILRLLRINGWAATTILHEVNRGVCATFNEALRAVETEYVAFIAADDFMMEQRISRQVAMLQGAGPDFAVACSEVHLVDETGTSIVGNLAGDHDLAAGAVVRPAAEATPWGEDGFFEAMLEAPLVMAPSALIRTSALRSIGGYDEALSFEDWDAWLRLARAGYRFTHTNEELVSYRQVGTSLWRSLEATPKYRLEETKILVKHLDYSADVELRLLPRLYHHAVALYKAGCNEPPVRKVIWRYTCRSWSPRAVVFAVLIGLRVPWQRFDRSAADRSNS
jgi:glycosyltransferase involved in cell wall biosynthesis